MNTPVKSKNFYKEGNKSENFSGGGSTYGGVIYGYSEYVYILPVQDARREDAAYLPV